MGSEKKNRSRKRSYGLCPKVKGHVERERNGDEERRRFEMISKYRLGNDQGKEFGLEKNKENLITSL